MKWLLNGYVHFVSNGLTMFSARYRIKNTNIYCRLSRHVVHSVTVVGNLFHPKGNKTLKTAKRLNYKQMGSVERIHDREDPSSIKLIFCKGEIYCSINKQFSFFFSRSFKMLFSQTSSTFLRARVEYNTTCVKLLALSYVDKSFVN